MGDVTTPGVLSLEPPLNWIEQLDAAVEREHERGGGPFPADLVASWLAWYAHQLAETYATLDAQRTVQQQVERRLERATRLIQQLTNLIVEELSFPSLDPCPTCAQSGDEDVVG